MCNPCVRYKVLPMCPEWTLKKMVGMRGFEPPTSCSRNKRSSQAELHPETNAGPYSAWLERFTLSAYFAHLRCASGAHLRCDRLSYIPKKYRKSDDCLTRARSSSQQVEEVRALCPKPSGLLEGSRADKRQGLVL